MADVLIVDDRPDDRELMRTLLTYGGHRVIPAARAEEALALALHERPDLVITDIVMPHTNGYELARRLRDEPGLAGLPVVFCTANYAAGEVRRLAEACGVSRLLEKPYSPAALLELVAGVTGAPPPALPAVRVSDAEFAREQARVANAALVAKVAELEALAAQRQRLVALLLGAQEDERRRIADDIHDDSIQAVVAVGLRLELLTRQLDDPGVRAAVNGLRGDVSEATARLRHLLFELRPRELDGPHLGSALRAYLDVACEQEGLQHVVDGDGAGMSETQRVLLFRLAREAIVNVRKHAAATRVAVALREADGGWELTVADDGLGLDPAAALHPRPGHLGLPAMRERVEAVGGRMELASPAAGGTVLTLWLPGADPEPLSRDDVPMAGLA